MRARFVAILLSTAALVGTTCEAARADVTLPAIFGDGMVLQRGRAVRVWGHAKPYEGVVVEIAGQSVRARADAQGRWSLQLEALEAGGPHEMKVRGSNEIVFADVLVGEVWVCSGQSNMALQLARAGDAEKEVAAANHPELRLLNVPPRPMEEPQEDFKGRWAACTPQTARGFSAVAYFFGRELHQELEVPVGLINTSVGGTPAEAWTSVYALEQKRDLEPLLARWNKVVERERKEPTRRGRLSPHRPGNLFNGMVAPLVPYTIRGAIWYQGESNAGRAWQYRSLFPTLIWDWRARWRLGEFPFYFVQLANFKRPPDEPGESAWAELRDAQLLTLRTVQNTGMAVIIDIGDARDIHPRNKQDVGARLAAWALAKDYGRDVPFSGPIYRSMKRSGKRAVLTFDHVDGGLETSDGEPPKGFAVAGRSRKFLWAKAKIEGDTVVVWHPKIRRIHAVRYAWADNPVTNLYNGAGLPASPFRTDEWGLTTEGKH